MGRAETWEEAERRLKAPFPADEIKWRVGTVSGDKKKVRPLAYIDARALQDRLDDIFGPENWENLFQAGPSGGVMAGICARIPSDGDGSWVWKWDGAENTDVEAIKGGISDSFKRAGVQWGIARYLYRLGTKYVPVGPRGECYAFSTGEGSNRLACYFTPPTLPAWALPAGPGKITDIENRIALFKQEAFKEIQGVKSVQALKAACNFRYAEAKEADILDEIGPWLKELHEQKLTDLGGEK